MPIPTGFDNIVKLVTGTPVGASELNTEIAARNTDGYWFNSLEFLDSDNAVLLFGKFDNVYPYTATQKVNSVAANQTAINSDIATEATGGYKPTGLFVTPGGDLLIAYQLLDEGALP